MTHSRRCQTENPAVLREELDNYLRSALVTSGETRRVFEIHAQLVEQQLRELRGVPRMESDSPPTPVEPPTTADPAAIRVARQ